MNLSGCATAPRREAIPSYSLNGSTYYPLSSLCEIKNIGWQYDTFTKTAILNKDAHRINLRVGDELVLVDGKIEYLRQPVDLYRGAVVVPARFKESIIDRLFSEYVIPAKASLSIPKIRKVVIDAGHGGNDPGAIGKTGVREKDINLDIAKRLGNILTSLGIEVVYTRNSDKFISLEKRVEISNHSKADFFISVHSNANRVRSLSGFEVYYVAPSVNDASRALASARSYSLNLQGASIANRSLNLKAILWDMIYTSSRSEAIELSRSICRSADRELDTRIIGTKGARFFVLKGVYMPAVLVEIGFLSNPGEERLLRNGFYRQKVADAITEGISDYAQGVPMEVAKR